MKRLVTLVVALAFAGAAFALDFSVGARGNFNMGLGTTFEKELQEDLKNMKDAGVDISYPLVVGGGFGVYGHIGFLDFANNLSLGATLEFGLNFHNGKSYKYNVDVEYNEYKKSISYSHTIDIPLMITLKVPVAETIKLDFGLGPNFSIPFGAGIVIGNEDGSYEESPYKDNYDKVTYNMNIGLVFDADVGFKVGPGYVLVDVRYLLDFTLTTANLTDYGSSAEKSEMFYRRSLNIGVGYEFNF
ncbi:MAG: PorT family protein [Treponema sp.]|nr:PorT family protein [Treponema sp.]MBD5442531.1 PorT family protein [Treponema sp.]